MKLTRVPVDFNVRCGLANGTILKGRALNLSTGGIFMLTAEPLVLGERLWVEFLLPSSPTPIQLKGESVWSRSCSDEMGGDKPPHVAGIKFINVPERYGHLIQDYILEMLSSKSPVVPEKSSR
jgi:Tfp pilus assembly protein PilZ